MRPTGSKSNPPSAVTFGRSAGAVARIDITSALPKESYRC